MDDVTTYAHVRGLLPGLAPESGSRIPAWAVPALPEDVVRVARVPAGVHLAFRGTAMSVVLEVHRGPATWRHAPDLAEAFTVHAGDRPPRTVPLPTDAVTVRIPLPDRAPDTAVRVYLPETVEMRLGGLRPCDGEITAAPRGPRWVAHGDSITQGWSVTAAGLGWPSLVAERLGLDLVNLGFAGAARGEPAVAEVIACSDADVVTLAWGTNSWSTTPATSAELAERMRHHLAVVRRGLPEAPILVLGPVLRPAAERTPNSAGATLTDLRAAVEAAAAEFGVDRAVADDPAPVVVVPGHALLTAADLAEDGVHPTEAGHERLAAAVAPHLAAALAAAPRPITTRSLDPRPDPRPPSTS